jgi:hypothetical protein
MKEKYKECPKVTLLFKANSKITSQIRGFVPSKTGVQYGCNCKIYSTCSNGMMHAPMINTFDLLHLYDSKL